jgi:hypothetical protein
MIRCALCDGAVTFDVRVVARASRTAAAGEHDGALKVRVAAPPVEGAADAELLCFLARELGLSARSVEIVSGHASKSTSFTRRRSPSISRSPDP